jgi:cardiolipin synthase C
MVGAPAKPGRHSKRKKLHGAVGRSSGATLHAKTFSIDRQRVFIGSFNFDPRSFHLNTEMGILIESSAVAERIADAFDKEVP